MSRALAPWQDEDAPTPRDRYEDEPLLPLTPADVAWIHAYDAALEASRHPGPAR